MCERTIAKYEEELCPTKEKERQHQLLDVYYKKLQVVLHRTDVQQPPHIKEEEGDPQPPHIKEEKDHPQPPHIKEEEEEGWITQEGECLLGQEEDDVTKFPLTVVSVKTEEHEDKPPESSQLHHSPKPKTEPEMPTITPARKKRNYKPYYYTTLTDPQKEEVIDWLKAHPALYAKRMTEYKDTHTKDKLWEDKAAEMGVAVQALTTFYKSNRTQMSRLKRILGKFGDGAEREEDLSATDKWVWEQFSFLKDHIESVERRNVVSICGGSATPAAATATATGPALPPPTLISIQSDSGSDSQSTVESGRVSTESVDLKRTLLDFMSGKRGGPSTFARHIDEGLAQLPGDIKRATQMKLMSVLHEGQRQAEERQEMQQQQQQQVAPIQPMQPPLQYLPSSTSRQYPPRMVSQSPQWQPPPSQWSTQPMPGQQSTSVWGSQDPRYMHSQYPALYPQPSTSQTAITSPMTSPTILDLDTGASSTPQADKSSDLNLSDFVNTPP
ncbi:uncharacterized protein LOC133664630 isoform X2 [Entelurus aequoreus]|uniref:uncharacterized protein LOC133664630 isoform X2 n=1 Tax=Entelurus aequoreus TaxID=161455 RepID=UPI002B1E0450|nr:uncharacterized protein LOC133664630 isoform X2 [Entelurus aequoreus]